MIEFQKFDRSQRDRAYRRDDEAREQAIQPKLNFSWNRDNLNFSIQNLGLGPAIIKSYQIYANNKYVNSLGTYSYNDYTKTISQIFGLEEGDLRIDENTKFEVNAYMMTPDSIVDRGKDQYLFYIDYGSYESLYQRSNSQKRDYLISRRRVLSEKFEQNLSRIGMAFCYCSLTEKYCIPYGNNEDQTFVAECKSREKKQ